MIPETGFYRKVFLANDLSPQTCPAMRNVIFSKNGGGLQIFSAALLHVYAEQPV